MWHDIRCNNSFKGKPVGGWCGQLAMRISAESRGSFEYKCARCKRPRTIHIGTPAMQYAST